MLESENLAATPVEATWPSEQDLRSWLLLASAAVPAAVKASQLPHTQPQKTKCNHKVHHTPMSIWVTSRLAYRGCWCSNKETGASRCVLSIWALPAIG